MTPKEKIAEYQRQYYIKNKVQRTEYLKKWRSDNKERVKEYNKVWNAEHREHKAKYDQRWRAENPVLYLYGHRLSNIKYRYGLTEEMFIKLYQDQKGICLGCDIKLISPILHEEMKKYTDDPNLIEKVDYSHCYIDHDHSYNIEGKHSVSPDSVRGLLCQSCNVKDVLNPESDDYIYGVDGDLKKKQLVMNKIFIKQASDKGESK